MVKILSFVASVSWIMKNHFLFIFVTFIFIFLEKLFDPFNVSPLFLIAHLVFLGRGVQYFINRVLSDNIDSWLGWKILLVTSSSLQCYHAGSPLVFSHQIRHWFSLKYANFSGLHEWISNQEWFTLDFFNF